MSWRRAAVLAAAATWVAACTAAGSEAPPAPVEVPTADASTTIDDAAPARDGGADADARPPPLCSDAGWCETDLPAEGLEVRDVWPLASHAFAVYNPKGSTASKVGEFDGVAWTTLHSLSAAKAVWASGVDEVLAGGYGGPAEAPLLRGVRAAGVWTWSTALVGEQTVASIWGSSANDVYAVAAPGGLYHRAASGTWTLELPSDPTLTLARVLGTSATDVWVLGHRGACGFAAHKTNAGFVVVADGVPGTRTLPDGSAVDDCVLVPPAVSTATPWPSTAFRATLGTEPGVPFFPPAYAATANELEVSLADRLHRVSVGGDGGLQIQQGAFLLPGLRALWGPTASDVYVAGKGQVLRNRAVWSDGGTFEFSTVALNGTALRVQFRAIRGVGPSNLWVVGDSYALHKTTP